MKNVDTRFNQDDDSGTEMPLPNDMSVFKHGATLVGAKSYGKGKVQTLLPYGNSLVKYTSAKWLRPNGECVDEVGITPDYEVKNVVKGNVLYDNQLEKALDIAVEKEK